MKGVSIGKIYALKQSIPNILYKDITEDMNRRKHLWLKFLCRHSMNNLDISTLGD
jgi:translation initiation factor 2 beta subunit (eIF-2beta)/eIF-5